MELGEFKSERNICNKKKEKKRALKSSASSQSFMRADTSFVFIIRNSPWGVVLTSRGLK